MEVAIFSEKTGCFFRLTRMKKAAPAITERKEMMNSYPRPQFKRAEWLSLNGRWSFCMDQAESGRARGLAESKGFETPIRIPFCPESRLSGVAYRDFINCIWYHRRVRIPEEWTGKELILHFGGVDYACEVFIDGISAGKHTGGAVSFELDVTSHLTAGKSHDLVVCAVDHIRSHIQCFGKQSVSYANEKANYTRTTGIWGDVWLEPVSSGGLHSCTVIPDYDGGTFLFRPSFRKIRAGNRFRIRVCDGGRCVGERVVPCAEGIPVALPLEEPKEWSPRSPFLYGIEYAVTDAEGRVIDAVESYAGFRKFHVEGGRCFLNNRPIFLRFVLDQGFYEDGIWTPPDEDAIRRDIELAMRAGFNGARLHQKIFDERYHYHADRLGFLTWGEFPDWGIGFWQQFTVKAVDYFHAFRDFFPQWLAAVSRDLNHPSIVAWTPFNERNKPVDLEEHRRFLSDIYELTRSVDPTRPVNDTSGLIHARTDLWTVHNYTQDAVSLAEQLKRKPVFMYKPELEAEAWNGQPYLLDEFGGVTYIPAEKRSEPDGWRYGTPCDTAESALSRMEALTRTVIDCGLAGYCYTQLTDVEQERNGVYNFDRTPKFREEDLRKIFSLKPEWSAY